MTTSSLAVGIHATLTAVYGGDSYYDSSTSSDLSETIDKSDTTAAISSGTNPAVFGQSVTLTATVAANSPGAGTPAGTVAFYSGAHFLGNGTLAVVSGQDVATLTTSSIDIGAPTTVTAVYAGDSSFNTSTSSNLSETVTKDNTATALSSSSNPAVFGQSVTFTATVTASSPVPARRREP